MAKIGNQQLIDPLLVDEIYDLGVTLSLSPCVVVAKDAEDAVTIAPCGHAFDPSDSTWCDISQIKCTEVGDANKNQKRGVIMASFKAG